MRSKEPEATDCQGDESITNTVTEDCTPKMVSELPAKRRRPARARPRSDDAGGTLFPRRPFLPLIDAVRVEVDTTMIRREYEGFGGET